MSRRNDRNKGENTSLVHRSASETRCNWEKKWTEEHAIITTATGTTWYYMRQSNCMICPSLLKAPSNKSQLQQDLSTSVPKDAERIGTLISSFSSFVNLCKTPPPPSLLLAQLQKLYPYCQHPHSVRIFNKVQEEKTRGTAVGFQIQQKVELNNLSSFLGKLDSLSRKKHGQFAGAKIPFNFFLRGLNWNANFQDGHETSKN